jgi:chromosome segregation ATPase
LQSQISFLENSFAEIKQKLAESEANLAVNEDNYCEVQEALEDAVSKLAPLEQQLEEKEIEIVSLKEKQSALMAQLVNVDKNKEVTTSEFMAELSDAKSKIKSLEHELSDTYNQIDEIKKSKSLLEEQNFALAIKVDEVGQVDGNLRLLQTENSELRRNLLDIESKFSAFKEDAEATKADLGDVEQKLRDSDMQYQSLLKQLELKSEEYIALQSTQAEIILKYDDNLNSFQNRQQELQTELKLAHSKLEASLDREKTAEESRGLLQSKIVDLERQLSEFHSTVDMLQAKVEDLTSEVEVMTEKANEKVYRKMPNMKTFTNVKAGNRSERIARCH